MTNSQHGEWIQLWPDCRDLVLMMTNETIRKTSQDSKHTCACKHVFQMRSASKVLSETFLPWAVASEWKLPAAVRKLQSAASSTVHAAGRTTGSSQLPHSCYCCRCRWPRCWHRHWCRPGVIARPAVISHLEAVHWLLVAPHLPRCCQQRAAPE